MGPPPTPVPTSITISQNSITLTFIGATVTLFATIRDQNGSPISGTVTWSSSDPNIASVDASGLVTAVLNGTVTITATSGTLSATATVTVEQLASLIAILSGDGQTATVGQPLGEPIVVRADDQGGTPVAGAEVTFDATQSGGTVGASPVTADAQGVASTTWTLGTAAGLQQLLVAALGGSGSTQVSATGLAGPPSALLKGSGDAQTGAINLTLSQPVIVNLQDEFGNGVEGVLVTFAVTSGGGSVKPTTATTDADGNAQTAWTMGPALGPATLTATAPGFPPIEFTAIAEPATPDLVGGAASVAPENPTEQEMVTVTVPVSNIGTAATGGVFTVQLLVDGVEAGTRSVGPLGASQMLDAQITGGPFASGTRALSVVIDSDGTVTESDETNNTVSRTLSVTPQALLTAGTPVPNVGASMGTQLLFAFQLPAEDGSIEFRLRGGTGDADMFVNFGDRPLVKEDYERVSGAADSNETVRYDAALPGLYHVLIDAFSDFSGTTLTVVTGLEILPYNVEVVFIDSGSSTQNAAFTSAAARWEALIPVNIPGVSFVNNPQPANSCAQGQPPIEDMVDDVRIYVRIIEIDGPGGTLGQAGPCLVRLPSVLPILGFMQFDEIDLDRLETQGTLTSVILHEMGHVLGVGTIWGPGNTGLNLLRNPAISNPGADTHFVGPSAIQAFDDLGGLNYSGGAKVPVENSGTPGSTDGHWRESVLGRELMSPVLNSGVFNPLSALSVQSMADLGYRVDADAADPFTIVLPQAPALEEGPVIDLRGDIWRGPIRTLDERTQIARKSRR